MHIYLGSFWDRSLTPHFYANLGCQEPRVRFFFRTLDNTYFIREFKRYLINVYVPLQSLEIHEPPALGALATALGRPRHCVVNFGVRGVINKDLQEQTMIAGP